MTADEPPSGSAPPPHPEKDASKLVLKEIERGFDAQLDIFKNITTKAGTVLSVLIGSLIATLTIAGVIAHPPFWALVIPTVPFIAALISSCLVFLGTEVATGPTPESLAKLANESESALRAGLIDFYSDLVTGSSPTEDDPGFTGNRKLLHRRQRLFEVSVILLAITVAALVAVALYLA